ncbi:MAG: hypothetical protein QOJ52_3452 [Acidimicrobiaceae bacterium]|nr:hypothetical protein [Acidimicrobiaceae bacterium]
MPSPTEIHTPQAKPPAVQTAAATAVSRDDRRLTDTITSATTKANNAPEMYGMTPVKGYSPSSSAPSAARAAPRAMATISLVGDGARRPASGDGDGARDRDAVPEATASEPDGAAASGVTGGGPVGLGGVGGTAAGVAGAGGRSGAGVAASAMPGGSGNWDMDERE